jgi:hypothetical protein
MEQVLKQDNFMEQARKVLIQSLIWQMDHQGHKFLKHNTINKLLQ